MQVTETHKFKNEATRRFHDYVYSYAKRNEAGRDKVYAAYGLTEVKNPSTFFTQLRSGHRGVTLEQIYIARDEFGLNPGYLFETSDQEMLGFGSNIVEDNGEPAGYDYGMGDADMRRQIGKQLQQILKKHKIKVEPYAKQRLNISKQAMYDKLNGKTNVLLEEAMIVCEDTGESLEQFRRTPLPKGHHLQQMEMMQKMIEMLEAENAQLKKQVKGKK